MRKAIVVGLVAALLAVIAPPAYAAKKKAPPKKIPSTNLRLACPGEGSAPNHITYKVDKQTLLKFYNNSFCRNSWTRAQWGGTVKGVRVSTTLFVPAYGYTDLWKTELDPLPTRRVEWINVDMVNHPCNVIPAGRSYLYASGDDIYREWC